MRKQLIGFFLGRVAIISGRRDVDIVRDEFALQCLHLGQRLSGDNTGVGALFLGDRDGNGLFKPGRRTLDALLRRCRSEPHEDVTCRLFRSVADCGHVTQVNGAVAEKTNHDVADFFAAFQESAGFH